MTFGTSNTIVFWHKVSSNVNADQANDHEVNEAGALGIHHLFMASVVLRNQ